MELPPTQDPVELFKEWLTEARKSEPSDPEAMALATAGKEGRPSVRMVLLKNLDNGSFHFYTNMESRKGGELAANPHAALCFHWKSLSRQVRVEGRVEKIPGEMADDYFRTRPPLSRLGAWASRQSQPLASRAEIEARVEEDKKKFAGQEVPRPPYWQGYCVVPEKIEFWQEGEGRLHDRFLFTREGQGWAVARLSP
jgi:pyridoxamine 5'-phosphate oxidase